MNFLKNQGNEIPQSQTLKKIRSENLSRTSGNLGPIVPVALQYLYQGSTQVQGPPRQELSSHPGFITLFKTNINSLLDFSNLESYYLYMTWELNKFSNTSVTEFRTVLSFFRASNFRNGTDRHIPVRPIRQIRFRQ